MSCYLLKTSVVLLGSLLIPAQGAILITAEDPRVTTTRVAAALTADFNPATPGQAGSYIVSGFGAYTGDFAIRSSDQYGGADGTNYISVNNTGQMTLTLLTQVAYFGLWWSAGDAQNYLDFYQGETLLGTFATSNLLSVVEPDHFGKPDTAENPSEPYAYVNFYGTEGTTFDRIVFRNLATTNFETDNHSIQLMTAEQTGEPVAEIGPVPEPGQSALTGLALVGLTWLSRRRAAR